MECSYFVDFNSGFESRYYRYRKLKKSSDIAQDVWTRKFCSKHKCFFLGSWEELHESFVEETFINTIVPERMLRSDKER